MSTVLELNTEEAAAANLMAVKRIDPDAIDILATASHVALYAFDSAAKVWQKKNIDGVLYLVQRSSGVPRLLVNNRNAPTTFVQDLTPAIEFQTKPPYLMYRDPLDDSKPVQGIWFHDPAEIKEVVRAVKAVMKGSSSVPKAVPSALAPAPTPAPVPVPIPSQTGATGTVDGRGTSLLDKLKEAPKTYTQAVGSAPAPAPAPPSSGLVPSVAAFFQPGAPQPQAPAPTPAPHPDPYPSLLGFDGGAMHGAHLKPMVMPMVPAAPAPYPPQPAHPAAPLAAGTAAALASIGEVGIVLSRSQLQAVMSELVQDESFISMLHNKYLQMVMQQAQRR